MTIFTMLIFIFFYSNPVDKGLFAFNGVRKCVNNILVTNILFYIGISSSLLFSLLIMQHFYVRCVEKKTLWIFKNDKKSLFQLLFFIATILDLVVALIYVISGGNDLIAEDIGITLAASFSSFCTLYGLTIYFSLILGFLKSFGGVVSTREGIKLTKKLNFLALSAHFLPPLMAIVCFAPVLGIIFPEYSSITIKVLIVGIGIIALLFGLLSTTAFRFLLSTLSEHLSSQECTDDIKLVYKRINRAYYALGSMCFQVTFFSLLFGLWEKLFSYCLSLYVFILISAPPAAATTIITVSRIFKRAELSQKIYPEDDPSLIERITQKAVELWSKKSITVLPLEEI